MSHCKIRLTWLKTSWKPYHHHFDVLLGQTLVTLHSPSWPVPQTLFLQLQLLQVPIQSHIREIKSWHFLYMRLCSQSLLYGTEGCIFFFFLKFIRQWSLAKELKYSTIFNSWHWLTNILYCYIRFHDYMTFKDLPEMFILPGFLHSSLWPAFQSKAWCSFEQYLATLHPPQVCNSA